MKNIKIYIFSLILLISSSLNVLAKQVNQNNSSDLSVEADISLEWFEKEKYYLAKGNVILKKDGLTLKANIVRANYDIENGENVLKNLIAKENVIVTKDNTKATGQFMTYDVEKKLQLYLVLFKPFHLQLDMLNQRKL